MKRIKISNMVSNLMKIKEELIKRRVDNGLYEYKMYIYMYIKNSKYIYIFLYIN
jgi:hypothetical protein